jgi:hypothetical protein
MTQDEIIEMARQAKWSGIYSQWVSPTERTHLTVPVTMEQMEAFAKLVAEKERERISQKIAQLPFGDTAQSFSIWVKNDT